MEKDIDIKAGMVFRNNTYERKCTIVNVFFDGDEEVITWKYWSVRKQRWYYETMQKRLFIIGFDYGDIWLNKKSKTMKKIKCTKTYYTHIPSDVLIDNGIEPTEFKNNSYPLFQEGKSYNVVGPVNTIVGRTILYVDGNIKTKHNNMFIHEIFYLDEFDEQKVKEWEEFMEPERVALMKVYLDEGDFKRVTKKPRNERYILDYFNYK